ncbi:MAG: PAS domain-containing protein, partial [Cyclobacteriaceae bacterium]
MTNEFFDNTNGKIFLELANNISQMVWIADENGKVIWYNKRWKDYTGNFTHEQEWWRLYHSDDIDEIKNKMQKGTDQKKAWEGTFRIKNQQGKYNWFLTRVVPNQDTETNELRWFATHTNVNRLMKLERDIINEKALLQAVIDNIPAMVTIYDPTTMSVQLNPAFENLTGWTNEDARKYNIMELAYPDPEYRDEVLEFMQKLGSFFKDIDMMTKNGKVLKTSWANERISDGRQVGIGIDITQRKQMEEDIKEANQQLLNLNRLLENLLYMAAHDLKSPIANL